MRASQNNLDLTYEIESDVPDQLIGDSLRLRQVITNLVGNAIKFMPSKVTRKGHVALGCRLLSLDDQMVTVEFAVMDTGIGIAKDKLMMIFDTFCQADGLTMRVSVPRDLIFCCCCCCYSFVNMFILFFSEIWRHRTWTVNFKTTS